MKIIRKTLHDLAKPPNLIDYERARANFDWSAAPRLCRGMGAGGCNIAFAAVDRHAHGRTGARTALRFIADSAGTGELLTRDISYAELGRLTRRFTNVLRSLGVGKGDRVFVLMGRTPELYVTMLGALRNGSVVSPLFSAFGPEPIATRVAIGEARVIVTTAAIYRRKIAKIRDQLTTVAHILLVDEDDSCAEDPATLNYRRLMAAADDHAPIEHTTADDPALLHFTSGTTGTPKGAVHVHERGRRPLRHRPVRARPAPRRRLLVHRRPRLGHRHVLRRSSRRSLTASRRSSTRPSSTPSAGTGSCRTSGVTVWYTAPTAIRMLMQGRARSWPASITFPRCASSPASASRSTPRRWCGADEVFGLPIHDNWWQTETGGIMIANTPACRHQARLDGPAAARGARPASCARRRRTAR